MVRSVVTGHAIDRGVMLRLPVAVHTPTHVEGVGHLDHIHAVYSAVTLRAVNAAADVRRVAELNVVGHVVDLDPLDGGAVAPSLGDLLDLRALGFDLRVTIHAGVHRRHTRDGAFTGVNVTVATRDLIDPCVKLVAESDGLFGSVALPGIKAG